MKLKTLLGLSIATALTACGGGSDESSADLSTIAGVYTGSGTYTDDNSTYEAAGLIAPDGRAMFITDDGEQDVLTINDPNSFSVNATAFLDTGEVGTGTLTGTFNGSNLTGQAKSGSTVLSNYAVSRKPTAAMTQAQLSGNYATEDAMTSIAIDTSGMITGSDTDGCNYTGSVKVFSNTTQNVYDAKVTMTCDDGITESFTGLATYDKVFDTDPQAGLIFAVANLTDQDAYTFIIYK